VLPVLNVVLVGVVIIVIAVAVVAFTGNAAATIDTTITSC
jgi:hypothetical protein